MKQRKNEYIHINTTLAYKSVEDVTGDDEILE